MTALLELDAMTAGYDGAAVLRGVSLRMAAGERVALLGRNGAGKTTLLHALFNIGPQVGGSLRFRGQPIAGWRPHRLARLGLALLPQGRGIFSGLTVEQSLRLPTLARPRGAWTAERVFAAFPRLRDRRTVPSSALSGGERQLLALGRALLTQPRLLLLDEVSEGLAPAVANELVFEHVAGLAGEGIAVLMAEQDLALALRLCGRAVVLAGGTVAFDGPADALLADPHLLGEHLGV